MREMRARPRSCVKRSQKRKTSSLSTLLPHAWLQRWRQQQRSSACCRPGTGRGMPRRDWLGHCSTQGKESGREYSLELAISGCWGTSSLLSCTALPPALPCLQHCPHARSRECTAGAPSKLSEENFQPRGADFLQHTRAIARGWICLSCLTATFSVFPWQTENKIPL